MRKTESRRKASTVGERVAMVVLSRYSGVDIVCNICHPQADRHVPTDQSNSIKYVHISFISTRLESPFGGTLRPVSNRAEHIRSLGGLGGLRGRDPGHKYTKSGGNWSRIVGVLRVIVK